jgi:hypothetical protein
MSDTLSPDAAATQIAEVFEQWTISADNRTDQVIDKRWTSPRTD